MWCHATSLSDESDNTMTQEQIEKAMSIVCMFEPVTMYQIKSMKTKDGRASAIIDIQRQCESSVQCFLEPQIKLPPPEYIAKAILHACGWVNVEIADDAHE